MFYVRFYKVLILGGCFSWASLPDKGTFGDCIFWNSSEYNSFRIIKVWNAEYIIPRLKVLP